MQTGERLAGNTAGGMYLCEPRRWRKKAQFGRTQPLRDGIKKIGVVDLEGVVHRLAWLGVWVRQFDREAYLDAVSRLRRTARARRRALEDGKTGERMFLVQFRCGLQAD